jgi:hypothetical protein
MSVTLQPDHAAVLLDRAQPQRRGVARRLTGLRRSIRWQLLVSGLAQTLALIVSLAACSLVADRWLRLELSSRLALGAAALVGICIFAWRRIVAPFGLHLADLDLAELVERRRPGVGQCIADVLQLPDLLSTPQFASPELVGAAIADQARELDRFDFHSLIDARRGRRNLLLLAGLLVLPALGAAVWPRTAGIWARRWLLADNIRWPQANYLALIGLGESDRLLTARGDGLVLKVTAAPNFQPDRQGWLLTGRGEPLIVEGVQQPDCAVPEQVNISYRFAGGTSKQASFTHFQGADFRYELPPLVESADVWIRGGDDWFGPVRIEPIDRPAVAELKLTSHPPGTEAVDVHVIGAADEPLLFLQETALELQLVATEALSRAEALAKDESPQALEQLDDRTFRLSWTMQEPRTFELRLVSAASGLASRPYFLTVGLLHDREPRLTLRASGVGRRVTPQARLPLAIHATDDFGLASLSLEMERTELADDKTQTTSKAWPLESFGDDPVVALPGVVDRSPELSLSEHTLSPGMSIRLRTSATDRCALGAHEGHSRWLGFQIVTPEELFYEILMRQREQRAKFAAALVQAQAQATALEKLDSLDGVLPLARVHQAIGRQVWQVAGVLDVTLREMTLNDLGNPTARQLLADSVIQPIRDLHTGPFEKLRADLDQLRAGDAVDPQQRDSALQLQREIVQSMQRILEQMSQWESFIDVVNQLRHILKLQADLKTSTEQAQKSQTDQLFDE